MSQKDGEAYELEACVRCKRRASYRLKPSRVGPMCMACWRRWVEDRWVEQQGQQEQQAIEDIS